MAGATSSRRGASPRPGASLWHDGRQPLPEGLTCCFVRSRSCTACSCAGLGRQREVQGGTPRIGQIPPVPNFLIYCYPVPSASPRRRVWLRRVLAPRRLERAVNFLSDNFCVPPSCTSPLLSSIIGALSFSCVSRAYFWCVPRDEPGKGRNHLHRQVRPLWLGRF